MKKAYARVWFALKMTRKRNKDFISQNSHPFIKSASRKQNGREKIPEIRTFNKQSINDQYNIHVHGFVK